MRLASSPRGCPRLLDLRDELPRTVGFRRIDMCETVPEGAKPVEGTL
jgi:hypothetical protein